jgi:hypothetical protein
MASPFPGPKHPTKLPTLTHISGHFGHYPGYSSLWDHLIASAGVSNDANSLDGDNDSNGLESDYER